MVQSQMMFSGVETAALAEALQLATTELESLR
jgi:hypothetical protein